MRLSLSILMLLSSVLVHAQSPRRLLYLPFDGDAGTDATVQGKPGYIDGVLGKAIVVGGKDRVVYPAASHFNPKAGSLTCWIAPVDWTAQVDTFQFFAGIINTAGNNDLMLYKPHDNTSLVFLARNGGQEVRLLKKPIISWQRGEWHHIAATWNDKSYRFYIDGELIGTQPFLNLPAENWKHIVVGIVHPHWAKLGNEKSAVDDLAIYDGALDPYEVSKLFKTQREASPVLEHQTRQRTEMIKRIRTSNLAFTGNGAVVITSSFAHANKTYSDNLIDGDLDSAWRSYSGHLPQWIELRWEYPVRVNQLVLHEVEPSAISQWSVMAWDRTGVWRKVGVATGKSCSFDEVATDRLRLVIEANGGPFAQIAEIEALGPEDQVNVGALRPFWHGSHLWYPEPKKKVIMEPRYFRGTFDIHEDEKLQSAFIQLYTNDLYEVYVNGHKVAEGFKAMEPVVITEHLQTGRNCLAVIATPTSQPRWTHMAMTCDVTLNMDGATRYVAADDTWKVTNAAKPSADWMTREFDDSAWSVPLNVGRVGEAVWGRLSYQDVAARTSVVLQRVELPGETKPGETVAVRLHLRPKKPLKGDFVLVYELGEQPVLPGWGDYSVCRGTAILPTGAHWPIDRDTVVEIKVPLPPWAPQGDVPIRVEALNRHSGAGLALVDEQGKRLDAIGTIHIKRFEGSLDAPPSSPRHAARMTNDQPVKAFVIDNKKVAPFVHAYMKPSFERLYLSSTTGVHLYQARAYPLQFDGTDKTRQRICRLLDQHINNAARIDRDAKIIVFFDMRPSATWRKNNPQAALVTAQGNKGPQSYFSPEHEKMVVSELRKTVGYLEDQPYSSRIFAYHLITCGTPDSVLGGVEDNLFEKDRDKITLGDYNPHAIDAFRDWLRDKYESQQALSKAWRNDQVTFETATPINKHLTAIGSDGGVFHDPLKPGVGALTSDYFEFLSGGIWRFYMKLAAAVKQETGGRAIVGVYYGYDTVHMTGYNAIGGVIQNNNFDQDEMMTTDLIDYYAMVPSYGHRWAGTHFESQHTLASLLLHDRAFMAEIDTRTHTALIRNYGRQRSVHEAVEVLKRDTASLIMDGVGGWFGDWTSLGPRGVGYFSDPQVREVIKRAKEIYDMTIDLPRESRAEIAVFVSGKAWFHHDVGTATPIYHNLVRNMMYEQLPKIGAPYDVFRLEDLADPRVRDKYKLFIFINAFALTKSERATIRSLKDKTTLWFYAPGYVDPQTGLDIDHVSEVAGMHIAKRDVKEHMQYSITNNGHPITQNIEAGTKLGVSPYGYKISNELHPTAFGPVFNVIDSNAEILGEYADGRGALAVNGRSVYCAVPYMNRDLLRNIAEWAGVHMYCDAGVVVKAAGNMVMVHNGDRTRASVNVKFPAPRRITELFGDGPDIEFEDSSIGWIANRSATHLLLCE